MTKDEALDLALEVLESERDKYLEWGDEDGAPEDVYDAITAIKQARSAPYVALPRVQEPVADVYMAGNMQTNIGTNGRVVYVSTVYSEKPLVKGDKLYTTPPGGRQSEDCLTAAQPVLPDVLTTADGEHPEYVSGWNDCRQSMLEKTK
jgi:hypothetical protein